MLLLYKVEKTFYLNDTAYTAVKRGAEFYTRYVKELPVLFVNRRFTKEVSFS